MEVENQGDDFNLANPDELIASVNGTENVPQTPEVPETFGEIPSEQFFGGLSAATNGEITNYEQFNEWRGYKDRFAELQKKANEQEARLQINPFASDLTKALNEMQRDGATQDEMIHFMNLQKLNVQEMSNQDAIIMAKKMAMKGQLSDAELQEWYREEYENVEEGEQLTGGQKVKLSEAAQAAREQLSQLKVDSGEPAAVRQNRVNQQRFQQRADMWGKVLHGSFLSSETQKFSANIDKDENGNDISLDLDFPVPMDVRSEISTLAAQYAAQKGYNGTQEQLADVNQFCRNMLWVKLGPQIYEAGIRHAKSKATEEVNQRHHNVQPIGSNQPNKKTKDPSSDQKIIAWAKKQKPFG